MMLKMNKEKLLGSVLDMKTLKATSNTALKSKKKRMKIYMTTMMSMIINTNGMIHARGMLSSLLIIKDKRGMADTQGMMKELI
jgi:hypothetical protein